MGTTTLTLVRSHLYLMLFNTRTNTLTLVRCHLILNVV